MVVSVLSAALFAALAHVAGTAKPSEEACLSESHPFLSFSAAPVIDSKVGEPDLEGQVELTVD